MGIAQTVDDTQRRTKPVAVAIATFKKFSEDRCPNLAAMIAFWGFFSIFRCSLFSLPVWHGSCLQATRPRCSAT
jgi:uncharacterized BrkB/YihY/UPF0761 family membrane protein